MRSGGRVEGLRITNMPCMLAIIVLLVLPCGLTQQTDEHYIVEPTPALRLGEDDLTTVLLVNNDNRTEAHGRFLNVRPTVGVLTSTARTFIQEGVTTEYATQVLGTTLENGRLYAQLLRKSSRVLYDKENVITPSATAIGVVHTSIVGEGPHYHLFAQPKSLLQSHNDLVGDKDWQDVDDRIILEKNSFVGNTDYVGSVPRASQVVFPVKSVSSSDSGSRQEVVAFNKNFSSSRSTISSEAFRIKANKVQPAVDLPTFTVKNMFSPSGFSWESSPFEGERKETFETHSQVTVSEQRSPKLLYHQVLKDEHRQLSTVTYYGFADFTTVVGDSVIVFSPSTSSDQVPLGHVTSIKGEATLGRQESSYVSNVAITITQDLIEPTFVVPMLSTDVSDLQIKPKDMRIKNEEELNQFEPPVEMEAEIEVTTVPQEERQPLEVVTYEIQTSVEIPMEDTEERTTLPPVIEDNIGTTLLPPAEEEEEEQQQRNEHEDEIILASSMSDVDSTAATTTLTPEPSPVETTSRVMLSRPSDEEILRIYSSLASAEAAKKASDVSEASLASIAVETTTQTTTEATTESVDDSEETITTSPPITTTEEPIQPDVKIQGGATTIFFEDDPFLDFVSPSSTEPTATAATQVHTQTSENTETAILVEQTSSTSDSPEEEKTNPPTDLQTENVTEDVPVTEATEPNIEATTTLPATDDIEDDKGEKTPETPVSDVVFKPIIKEIDENEQIEGCSRTSQVFLTQIPKTLTYYTTFFIPDEQNEGETSTSVETNIVPSFDIGQATKHYCIQPTQVVNVLQATELPVLERPSKPEESNAIDSDIEEQLPEATTPMMIVRENAEVTESSDIDASGAGYDEEDEDEDEDEEDQDSGEEIELIYKTLYTTYTYLTTFFHDATTSVSSRKEVVTNVITSSLGMDNIQPSESVKIQATATESNQVTPTVSGVGIGRPTAKFVVQSSDLVKVDSESDSLAKPTLQLDDSKIAKTYYTTYTYYTTIFVEGETEVMSRTEVHTNIVGKATEIGSSHSARNLNIDDTVSDEDNAVIDIRPTATYDTIQRTAIASEVFRPEPKQIESQLKYTTLNRGGIQELESSSSSSSSRTEKKIVPIDEDSIKTVTDVRSSSSNGDHHLIENGVLEDQISSESNTDEILPSATLLLQTSFTTFTYYTTMYSSEATNVVSRLETVTNVVTETLQPTKTLSVEEATLPITYFTTFTYWTKLAKDGEITTLSREETVSNVVTPTLSSDSTTTPTVTSEQPVYVAESAASVESVSPLSNALSGLEPTTYYTTYTYYTTSYAGDQTITDSRFETVTNVVTPSSPIPAPVATEEVSKMNQLEAASAEVKLIDPPKTLSFDYKTIVDAEGISTLYFKTELVATTIDGVSTEVASSTSTINIDEVKKALSPTTSIPEGSESTRTYKTGLVRLIEGTKLLNHTTTIYQSKVIGTIIDQRYAQIIESTSSFIIEKTQAPVIDGVAQISATSTLSPTSVQPTAFIAASSSKAIESSIGDAAEQETEQTHDEEEEEEDENDSEEEEDDDSGRPRTRLSFQTKKKTFTPVIRPFASRNRPQFAPKRKNLLPSSATIITRSDFTPTITATPAIKSESRGRFSSSRKSNSGLSSSGISGSSSQGGKRFGRPSKSSQFGGFGSSSRFPGSSRNSLQSSRVQGSSSSFGGFASSRRSGTPFRGGSSTNIRSFSSAYAGNSRLRIRPSSSLPYDSAPNTAGYTTLPPESGEEDGVTQRYDSEEETDVTTENLRRNNNPLLRFRRPQVSRPPFQPGQRNAPSNQVSGRRNPLTPKPKTAATTSTTTTTNRPRPRAFQRPAVGGIQNRARPQSNLFPPRRLFQQQNQAIDEEQKTGDDFHDNDDEDSDSAEYENDEEGDDEEQDATNRRRRDSFTKRLQIKKRSKRQANNFRNRFRRPSTSRPVTEDRIEEEEAPPSTARSRASSRFTPRTHSLPTSTHANSRAPPSNGRAIRPTKPNSNSRSQFTLRESNTTPKLPSRPSTNFRRPVPNGGGRRTTTTASRPKAPRLKSYGSTVTESSHHTSPRGKTPSSRSRSTARGRSRNDFVTDPAIPVFDGTITVTHTSPTEITIPVVNGKVTEYKNVVTSTTSLEVILPNQYTSIIGQNGASTLILNREETVVNANGANEVTQFILHESPTTSVIFTPTTIRGRKTSFAHVIPSTAYQVENVVSTMQAQLAANAPLANILLSQLLLGNIGLNQANLNPLLGLGATQAVSQAPGEPATEYKTRTSTYVTTVTNGMSTVIPLTFHGKEILTTIFDSSSNVITATEYFTDTIVVTPTQQAQQQQQVNSLLLPLLLQQQLQQQPQQPLPIQNSIPPQLLLADNLQDLDSNGIQKYNDYSQDIEDYPNPQDELVEASQNTHTTRKSNGRKKGRKFNKQHSAPAPAPVFESSVITLYVSGRRPGEFSTVLSTVQVGSDSTLRKRHINRAQPVLKSDSLDYEDFYRSDGSEIREYLLPATNDITSSSQIINSNSLSEETQSLESIVGDVGLWYAKTSAQFGPSSGDQSSTTYDALQSSSSSAKIESSLEEAANSQSKYFLV